MKTIEGTTLTPEVIDALAAEAEAGYDLTKAKRVYRGRPSLGVSGQSPKIQIRLDQQLAKSLRDRAAKENRTLSDIAREALRNYVEQS